MAFTVSTIGPEQLRSYQQGRSNARTTNLQNQAKTQYQRNLAGQAYNDRTQDFATQQNRLREQLPTSYINRGTFRSGIYRDALKRYAIDRLAGQRNLQRDYQLEQQGLTFGARGSSDELAQTLANLYGEQYAAQAQIASALKGIGI
jgi:hypothetical protein